MDREDHAGRTPLMQAATSGHEKAVRFLIEKGADVHHRDRAGWTPLMFAVSRGEMESARVLLDHKADISARSTHGTTPLMFAASGGHLKTVRFLIDRGVSLEEKSRWGHTALFAAASGGRTDVLCFLIERGASMDVRENNGATPLMAAARYGHMDSARVLIDSGVDIDAADHDGWNPLLFAARSGRKEMVALLLDRGANPNVQTRLGETAAMAACEEGHRDVYQFLIGRSGDDSGNPNQTLLTQFRTLICTGDLHMWDQFMVEARRDYQEALDLARQMDDSLKQTARSLALGRLSRLLGMDGRDLDAAARMREKIDIDLKLLEIGRVSATLLSQDYGLSGWWLLLAGRTQEALDTALKAIKLDPNLDFAKVNLAHAYLLNGDFDKAAQIHRSNATVTLSNGKTWKDVVDNDFKILREKNINHPDMIKIEHLLKM